MRKHLTSPSAKLAGIAAGERRQLEAIDRRYALESFVSWSVRRRDESKREAPFLERHAEREEQREAQRAAIELAKAHIELEASEPQRKSRGLRR